MLVKIITFEAGIAGLNKWQIEIALLIQNKVRIQLNDRRQ